MEAHVIVLKMCLPPIRMIRHISTSLSGKSCRWRAHLCLSHEDVLWRKEQLLPSLQALEQGITGPLLRCKIFHSAQLLRGLQGSRDQQNTWASRNSAALATIVDACSSVGCQQLQKPTSVSCQLPVAHGAVVERWCITGSSSPLCMQPAAAGKSVQQHLAALVASQCSPESSNDVFCHPTASWLGGLSAQTNCDIISKCQRNRFVGYSFTCRLPTDLSIRILHCQFACYSNPFTY